MKSYQKNRQTKGFTIVEVALFLAISGLLLGGIVAASQKTIAEQRYNDSVQSFADFLRDIYASTVNPQSFGQGIEDRALYGYAVIFKDTDSSNISVQKITGVADADQFIGKTPLEAIQSSEFGASFSDEDIYKTKWGAEVQNRDGGYNGSLLVVHSPTGGGIGTYISDDTNNVGDIIANAKTPTEDIVFCIASEDSAARRGVKVDKNGQNAGAVSIISQDDERCR